MRFAQLMMGLVAFIPGTAAWAQTPEGAQPQEGPGFSVDYKDGLSFKNADGNVDLKLTGWAIENYRLAFDRPTSARNSPDSFYAREVSIAMSGVLFKEYDFNVESNFAPTPPGVLDAWIGWKRFREFSLRFGNMKEPFSQEETTSLKWIDFVEKSDLNRLVPGRSLGAMAFGKLFDDVFSYEIGVYNGEGGNAVDTNNEKEGALRLRFSPFAGAAEDAPLKGLRIGVAGTQSHVTAASGKFFNLTTTGLQAQFVDITGSGNGMIDGPRRRLGVELSWLYGPFGLRAEYVKRTDTVTVGSVEDDRIATTAWYVAATWLVTGEKKPLEARIIPANPFDPAAGKWGALEIAVRIDGLRLDSRAFDIGIASPTGNAKGVMAFSAGANWWLTRSFRISPDFVYEKYSSDVAFTGSDQLDHLTGVLTKFELTF